MQPTSCHLGDVTVFDIQNDESLAVAAFVR
jgi:hypothetical protein